jgi:N-acetyl-anhydromuramoyl-L-alanine amidase
MFVEIVQPSPNCDAQPRNEALGVVFHHSSETFTKTIALMSRAESKVSYHVLIDTDGTRCRMVADDHIAWHAGASHFLGRDRCNDFMLGAAFAGDTYAAPLTSAQIASALDWLALRWSRYQWSIDRMIDHRQISPGRKNDLNPVEWDRLRLAIVGRFGPVITGATVG